MNRKERKRILKEIENTALRSSITKESIGSEHDYENVIAQAHELDPDQQVSPGVMGPNIPEPEEYDPY